MHVVLKSDLATGAHSFLRIERQIVSLIQKLGLNLNVQVCDVVVMGNHIHLSLRVKSRRAFQNYLRALSGLIARKVLGAEKNCRAKLRNFFRGRPFSRIVASGRKAFTDLRNYFELNRLERRGFSKAQSREWGLIHRFANQSFDAFANAGSVHYNGRHERERQ